MLISLIVRILSSRINKGRIFPEKISAYFKRLIDETGSNTGLKRQILYDDEELREVEGFVSQPVKDEQFALSPGIIQKYRNRILLIFSTHCPAHCRYCFRREYPYGENHYTRQHGENLIRICRENNSLREIILSGGDPLCASNIEFEHFIALVNTLPNIKRIRIHTRMLSFNPHRLKSWIPLWRFSTKRLIFVTHFNQKEELTPSLKFIIRELKKTGFTLLNQSVLLKGINDNLEELVSLSEALDDYDILPYYLHQLDRVQGSGHFEVPLSISRKLVEDLAKELPGYLVPKYVKEIPGEGNKRLL